MAALAVASASSGAGRVGIAVGEHARSSMRGLAAELGALHDQHPQPILVEGTRQHSPMMPPPTMTVSQDFTADIVKRGGALATCPRHTELLAAGDGSLGNAAGGGRCRILHHFGEHDEPIGRGSDVVRGIAGDQGQAAVGTWAEHRKVFRLHHLLAGDPVGVDIAVATHLDAVAL